MIKTFTLNAGIEKRVQGQRLDEVQFKMQSTSQQVDGIGVKVAMFLRCYNIESHAYVMGPQSVCAFIETTLKEHEITATIVENDAKVKINTIYIDEDESCDKITESDTLNDTHVRLFQAIIENDVKADDIVVLEYNEPHLQTSTMTCFYEALARRSKVKICDVHPNYWSMFQLNPTDVLVIDEQQCLFRLQKERIALSEMITFIQKEIVGYAKLVVYTMQCNDLLLFVEGKVYRVTCSVKQHHKKCYKEAIISGILKCYSEDGDLVKLSEECMSMSVGTSLSEGLYIPNETLLAQIKQKVMLYSL